MCSCFQYSVPVGRACHSCLCMTFYLHKDRYIWIRIRIFIVLVQVYKDICRYECALAQTRLQPWLVYPVWEDYQISSNGVWFWIVSWLPVPHPLSPPSPWYNCTGWLGVAVIYQVTYPLSPHLCPEVFHVIMVAGLDLLKTAIEKAGYTGKIQIGMDVAASEFFKDGKYDLDFKNKDSKPETWVSVLGLSLKGASNGQNQRSKKVDVTVWRWASFAFSGHNCYKKCTSVPSTNTFRLYGSNCFLQLRFLWSIAYSVWQKIWCVFFFQRLVSPACFR